jgi:hypothetical protein
MATGQALPVRARTAPQSREKRPRWSCTRKYNGDEAIYWPLCSLGRFAGKVLEVNVLRLPFVQAKRVALTVSGAKERMRLPWSAVA